MIEKFLNQSKNDNTLPHPYASYSIIVNLSSLIFGQEYVEDMEQWRNIRTEVISNSASELLLQNSKRLYDAGYETEGVI